MEGLELVTRVGVCRVDGRVRAIIVCGSGKVRILRIGGGWEALTILGFASRWEGLSILGFGFWSGSEWLAGGGGVDGVGVVDGDGCSVHTIGEGRVYVRGKELDKLG